MTGEQDTIIPAANAPNLMVSEEVVEAARAGGFRIWAVYTIKEGIELLSGCPEGQRGPGGCYLEDSVYQLVEERLYEAIDRDRQVTNQHATL